MYSFTTSVFPVSAPGYSDIVYFTMAAIAAFLFFASLLAHELAHAVVARRYGIEVAGITLFMFGGVAHLKRSPASAGEEFWIAIVGPLMSFAVAGMMWLASAGGDRIGVTSAITTVPYHIAGLNVLLAVFNLLPGFPLDGGRVFRAIVWKISGDAQFSMKLASIIGELLGWGMVALGIFDALRGDVMGGLWFAFIGFFLRNAAKSARATVRPELPQAESGGAA
jgi:Zn-dependent protease